MIRDHGHRSGQRTADTPAFPGECDSRQPFRSDFVQLAEQLCAGIPNQPGTISGANNFLANRKNVETGIGTWHLARIDHQLTASDKLYGRFSIDKPTYPQGGPYRGLKGQNADPFDVNVLQTGKTVGIGYTRVIDPATLSDFRFGYVAFNLDLQALGDQPDVWQKDTAGKLGLKNVSIDTFPYFAPAGYGAIGGSGGSFGGRQNLIYKTMRAFQFGETISRQQGRHSLRVGFEWETFEGRICIPALALRPDHVRQSPHRPTGGCDHRKMLSLRCC